MITGYLGLGSNLADPPHRLLSAVYELEMVGQFKILRASSLYYSAPWGYESEHEFCNQVLHFSWDGILAGLWLHSLQVEANLGRARPGEDELRPSVDQPGYRDRTIDIDLLDATGVHAAELTSSRIELPHPRAHQRAFVLVPWAELEQDYELRGKPLRHWLDELPPEEVASVRKLEPEELPHQFTAHLLRSGK